MPRYVEQLTVDDLRRAFESWVVDNNVLDIDISPAAAASPALRRRALNKMWIRFFRRVIRRSSVVEKDVTHPLR